jgi:hypothetical protein
MVLVMKVIVALAFLFVGFALYRVYIYAKIGARVAHPKWARIALAATLIAALVTELFVLANGGVKNFQIFLVHISFAGPFFVLLCFLQWLNGFRKLSLHRPLGYTCLACFIGTVATGSVLLYYA